MDPKIMATLSRAGADVGRVASPETAGPQLVVVCRVRSWFCSLPLACVEEAMRPLAIEPLAGAPPFVRGLSIIRGAPTPVVDAGTLIGAPGGPLAGCLLLLRVGTRRVALMVEAVVGIRAILPETLGQLPPLLQDASREAVSAIGILDAALLVVLCAGHFVPQAVWDTVVTGRGLP
jgi:purine-binding chemotaxis protein CheW